MSAGLQIRRIDAARDDLRAQLEALRARLSPQGDIVSEAGRRRTIEVFGQPLSPREVVERICRDVRQQGLSVLGQLRDNVNTGRMPGRTIADAMMIGVAALFLVLPGFLSDIVALALLLPPVRSWLYAALASRVTVVDTTTTWRRRDPSSGRIEGAIDLDEDDYRPR